MKKQTFDYFWRAYNKKEDLFNTRLNFPKPEKQGQPMPRVQGVSTSIPLGGRYLKGALGEDGRYYIGCSEFQDHLLCEDDHRDYFNLIGRWKDDLYMIKTPKTFSNGVMVCITAETFLEILFWFYAEENCPDSISSFVREVLKTHCYIPQIQEIINKLE